MIGFFLVIAWYGWEVIVILAGDRLTSLPWVPVWFTQSVIPIGSVLIALAEALDHSRALARGRGRDRGAGARGEPGMTVLAMLLGLLALSPDQRADRGRVGRRRGRGDGRRIRHGQPAHAPP